MWLREVCSFSVARLLGFSQALLEHPDHNNAFAL